MKAFQTYIAELNTSYKFRVKIAKIEPKGEVLEHIKNALNTYQLENIGTPKSLPIMEHRDFPRMGACECYIFDVTVKYPVTPAQLRGIIAARGLLNEECVCVYNEDTMTQEDAVQERIDSQGAVLTEPDYKTEPQGDIAGQPLVDSFIKELSTRKYEFAAKSDADGKSTNDIPQNNSSILKPNKTARGK